MKTAIWNGATIAESDDTIVVDGNHYFPRDSVRAALLHDSEKHTTCPWKGEASYYTIEVDGTRNENAAWTYLSPKPAAKNITEYIAFYKGVEIEDDSDAPGPGVLRRLASLFSR